MFAYAGLLLIPWLWFHYGIVWAASYLIFLSITGQLVSIRCALSIIAFGSICIATLQVQSTHTLPIQYQHDQFELTICADSIFKHYDDVMLGNAFIVSQPDELKLRRVSAAIGAKFELVNSPGLCIVGIFRVKQPFGQLLPGQFNADQYYFSQKIDAKVSLVKLERSYINDRLMFQLNRKAQPYFSDESHQQLWAALVLGWSSAMSAELKALLASNQLAHMFVVSGFHIGIIALIAHGLCFGIGWVLSPMYRLPLEIRYAGVFVLTTSYVAFIGWPIPALRALIMALVPLVCVVLSVKLSAYRSILMAAIIVLLLYPQTWLSIGNWLSFGSVLLIIVAIRWQLFANVSKITALFLFQLLMSLLSLFWSYFYGLSFNALGFFINLLASPFITFVIFPLAILMLWQPSLLVGVFEWFAERSLDLMKQSATFGVEGNTLYAYIALSIVLLVLFLVWQPEKKIIWLFSLSALAVWPVAVINPIKLNQQPNTNVVLRFFDVGHGLAVLIKTPSGTVLFDTGGRIGQEDSIYARKLSSLVPNIDALIVSHSDSDHSAGVLDVLEQHPSAKLFGGQPGLLPIPSENCHDAPFVNDHSFFIPVPYNLQKNDNDQSCVLVIEHVGKRIILTGDAGKNVEYFLMQAYPQLLPFDVVVLGHHGSASSSATDWLKANKEAFFVNSGADMARGSWPATAIRSWFESEKIALANTAKRGTLDVFVTQVDIHIKSYESAFRKRLIY
ncbi:ComEC/Rec2 family competence protein [Reinekea marina]|uniref:ComEC/Rec2 family competence protein n=1 Tax=Reinekea marina TaxID=1310421 RepID=A0ABV7WUD1_9GAMM|nr:ComEC/Rec2 family competence protein [Reinekea marina]MDN3649618.1 ComEC/Rec2 family competence protein [Reinekea marina]